MLQDCCRKWGETMGNESQKSSRRYCQRSEILELIRYGQNVSRFDIKKATAYSMTTVLTIIDELIDEGLIYEEECNETRIGRKPVWLRLNPDAGYFIGIEFNSREMHCIILDFTGEVIYKNESMIQQINSNADAVLNMLKKHIQMAMSQIPGKRIFGIGVGVPGYCDKKRGIAISYPHLQNWNRIPLKQIIEEQFEIPCYIDNNVGGMIYAYKYLVYNGTCEDMLFISVRTGARVIPIINNMPVSGYRGFPGEMGHIKVSSGSRMCSCGKYGCLNSEISDYAIISKIRDGIGIGHFRDILARANGNVDEISMDDFIASALDKAPDSLKLMEQVAGYLGEVISILVNIFAPRKIILYGNLAQIGEPFLKLLMKHVKQNALMENYTGLQLAACEFGKELGAIGAATLALKEEFA